MKLADDDRGRVPFALVGVVLLVSSATVAVTVETSTPVADDSRAGLAVQDAQSAARTALRTAFRRGAREAARNPVVEPANTTYGRTLNESTAFRDWLRIRSYVEMRDALARLGPARADGVRARVSLPPVTDAASLREAERRVRLERVGDRELEVTLRNVTVTAVTADGRRLARRTYAPRFVVETPVLALHERTAAYERSLHDGGLTGLRSRVTARLHAVAEARGLAQYGGAPVANVLANRHVELSTNGALLQLQRTAFGRADADGRADLRRATARVGATGLANGLATAVEAGGRERSRGGDADRSDGDDAGEAVTGDAENGGRGRDTGSGQADGRDLLGVGYRSPATEPATNRSVTVGVDGTADRAFLGLLDHPGNESLDEIVDAAYRVRARLESSVDRVGNTTEIEGGVPSNWSRRSVERASETTVTNASHRTDPDPAAGRLASFVRTVTVRRSETTRWEVDGETRTTRRTRVERYRVRLVVRARYANLPHVAGTPTDAGLAAARAESVRRLVAERGGGDALARRAVDGRLDDRRVTVSLARSPGVGERVYRDVAALRERVRNVSVEFEPSEVDEATPAERLLRAVERRAGALQGRAADDSRAERARIAARATYLARVQSALASKAETGESVRKRVDDLLAEAGVDGEPAPDPPWVARTDAGFEVDADPAYLTLSAVEATDGSKRYYPLAARNTNYFTVPYGDAADAVANAAVGRRPAAVRLGTAAGTLRAANRTLAETENATLARDRDALRAAVERSLGRLRHRLRAEVHRRARSLTAAERRSIVATASGRWDTVHGTALAAANGSLAGALATETAARIDANATARDELAVRFGVGLEAAVAEAEVRPPEGVVDAVDATARSVARHAVKEGVQRGLESVGSRVGRRLPGPLGAVPAGLPVAPVPGFWYATLNVWRVSVHGEYGRFAVRAPAATPAPTPAVTYVRRGGRVTLDVDGDGAGELFGRNEPVAFEVETGVLVVVPPGPRGVGDVDGNANERSPGWPPDG